MTNVSPSKEQIASVISLFSSGKFPVGVEPTAVPEGIAEYANVSKYQEQDKKEQPKSPYGFQGYYEALKCLTKPLRALRGLLL